MFSLVLLAGGTGSRMGMSTPKQYIFFENKPLALFSLEEFKKISDISEIIVVCASEYQPIFSPYSVTFAMPGVRRQDSVYSGLKKCTKEYVLIHDSARPFIESQYIYSLMNTIKETGGAAALAVPVTNTIKQCKSDGTVEKTLHRSQLWEMQTPQGAKREILLKAYELVERQNLEVTDDLSALEMIDHPATIVPSSPKNFKVTTPFDLAVAKILCASN